MSDQLLTRLRAVLRKPDTVLFVGAGLSIWSGLPSWPQLLLDLAVFRDSLGLSSDLIRRELARGDLLQAASYGFMDLTPIQRREFISSECNVGTAVSSDAHRALLRLPPRCFVTTNYDTLLEQALAEARPHEFYQVITNRQPVEQPTLLRATASQFIFKPHGHVTDIESVVLTREDYRRLAHDSRSTLRTLGTLLVTRPIVFVGFGLRDPDFLMVSDSIAADYRGGAPDHYSLVLNPHPDEIRYWRDAYGVTLIGYPEAAEDEPNRHRGLLDLLAGLAEEPASVPRPAQSSTGPSADQRLELIRLAARNRRQTDSVDTVDEIPVRVHLPVGHPPPQSRKAHFFGWDLYSRALARVDGSVFIFGPPGAGKTFGALRHIRKLASELSEKCMAPEPPSWGELAVPLYISLRLYDGNLFDLVEQQLPAELDVRLLDQCQVFMVFDGINEVPQAHLDDGSFLAGLEDLLSKPPFKSSISLFLGRAIHESPRAEAVILELDKIDDRWLAQRLPELGSLEVRHAVSRPIIYRMIRDGIVPLADVETPADIYRLYFDQLLNRLSDPLRRDGLKALQLMAFETVSDGSQATPFARVISRLARRHTHAEELATKLVDLEFLQPVAESRVTFPHHSFLEYLAALELIDRETAVPGTVTELSALRAWDYVAVFAASLAGDELRSRIVHQLLKIDTPVAIRAILHSGHVEPSLVTEVLTTVKDLWPIHSMEFDLEYLLSLMPIHHEHGPLLDSLLLHGGSLSAVGASLALKLRGAAAAPPVIDCLARHADDYNVSNSIGRSLARYMDVPMMRQLLDRLEQVGHELHVEWLEKERGGPSLNLSSAASEALKLLSPADVLRILNPTTATGLELRILCDWLWDTDTAEGMDATLFLLHRGEQHAIFPFYKFLAFPDAVNPKDFPIEAEVVETLVQFASGEEPDRWAAEALLLLGQQIPESRELLAHHARSSDGMLRLILTIASEGSNAATHAEEVRLAVSQKLGRDDAHWELVDALDIEWTEFPDLLERIMQSDNDHAINSVLQDVQDKDLPAIDIIDIDSWLRRIGYWFERNKSAAFRLAQVLARAVTAKDELRIARALDDLDGEARNAIVQLILPRLSTITTDELSPSTISVLLSLELAGDSDGWWIRDSALARLATERFVERVLIPILGNERDAERRQVLVQILDAAGRRHGRRYVGSEGQLLG